MLRHTLILGSALLLGGAALVAGAQEPGTPQPSTPTQPGDDAVIVDAYLAPDGSRVLRHSIVVPATPREVWTALTTAEGWKTWAVPVAYADFRLGGIIETSYRPGAVQGDPANIKNTILSYLPLRMVSFQAVQAPPGFPHAELLPTLFSVMEIEPVDAERTRVSCAGVGYFAGEGYDQLYAFFAKGNAWTLQRLRQRFLEGPIDWSKAGGGH